MIRRLIAIAIMAGAVALVAMAPAFATTSKGHLFHDGDTVGTVGTPVHFPNQGTDPIYEVTNGADGQLGIAGVAPADGPYHGGRWEVFTVTFNAGITPYLLTSDDAVFAAQVAGDVTVTRDGTADFRCPVLP